MGLTKENRFQLTIKTAAEINVAVNGTHAPNCRISGYPVQRERIVKTLIYCLFVVVSSVAGNYCIGIIVYKKKTMKKSIKNDNNTEINCRISGDPVQRERIVKTLIYCLFVVVSLAGNFCIGITVYKKKTMRKSIGNDNNTENLKKPNKLQGCYLHVLKKL